MKANIDVWCVRFQLATWDEPPQKAEIKWIENLFLLSRKTLWNLFSFVRFQFRYFQIFE